jgi:hypothetical protein
MEARASTRALGYEATMVRDATAVLSDEEMRATPDVIPDYVDVALSINELTDSI